ncbi:hypothetical protein [Granulicella mallensis]|uniref:Uncharacterized protein n=1 Tax=Granulicella mallensis TaxID=940614 RepID=A0A7W8E865_9BACT|nr:hypothetical protein [Granulicella mallensis]MBB5062194.1 hypothetical protein [Granulicella mallensis]
MGIAFVLLFYAGALSIAAVVSMGVLFALVAFFTRHVESGRKRALAFSLLLPPCCVLFCGLSFPCYWVINDTIFHRDAGLGDSWYTPMPNGYMLQMIDVTEYGSISAPQKQADGETVSNVRRLQVDGDMISGTSDSLALQSFGRSEDAEDQYFILNAKNGVKQQFKSMAEFNQAIQNLGLHQHLRPFWNVFCDYRNSWFDYVYAVGLLLLPLAGLGMLLGYVLRIRKTSENSRSSSYRR